MKKKLLKISIYALLAITILLTIIGVKIMASVSLGAGTAEVLLEASLEKYINYNVSEEEKGTLVQYKVKAKIEQEDPVPIENSEIKIKLNRIDEKYPNRVTVVGKGINLEGKYEYNSEVGEVILKEAMEKEDNEYEVIGYYDTYLEEIEERNLEANVTATAILAGEENFTVTANQKLEDNVLENVGQLTSIRHVTEDIYNGYIKANQINGTDYHTEYQETEEIVISKKQAQENIEMTENNTFENGEIGAIYKNTKINKETLIEVLGEEGKVEILDQEGNSIAVLDKENTEINYEEGLENISIKTTEIQKEGILEIEHKKEIVPTMEEVKNAQLKTTTILSGVEEALEDRIEIKDASTKVDIAINNTEWTNKQQNEITFDVPLRANGKEDNLFKNPELRIELPNEVEKVILQNSGVFYPNGLELQNCYIEENTQGNKVMVASLEGNQTQYTENELDLTTDVKISATIILKKDIETTDSNLKLTYKNQYDGVEQGEKDVALKLESYQEEVAPIQEEVAQSYQLATAMPEVSLADVEGLKLEVAPIKGDVALNDGDTVYEGEYIKYNIKVTNTSDHTMEDVKVVATIPEGLTYGELEADYYNISGKYKYNFDKEMTSKEIEIGTLEPGKSENKFYEVQVDDLAEGETQKEIKSDIQVTVQGTEASKYEITNKVKTAKYKVFLRSNIYTERYMWNYWIKVESDEEKEVEVKVKLPKEFTPEYFFADQRIQYYYDETNTPKDNIFIVKVLTNHESYISGKIFSSNIIEQTEESKVELKAVATVGEDNITYCSNENRILCEYENVSISMTSDNEGEEVKYEDEINYDITIKNIGRNNSNDAEYKTIIVKLSDYLPEEVQPVSVTYQKWEIERVQVETTETQTDEIPYVVTGNYKKSDVITEDIQSMKDEQGNKLADLELYFEIPYQESVTIQIKTLAGFVYEKTKISNIAHVNGTNEDRSNIKERVSNTVTHTILPYDYEEQEELNEPEDPEIPTNPGNPNNPSEPNDPSNPTNKYGIEGLAWLDKNEDGQRQAQEKLLSGITVMIVDMKDTKNVKAKATTDSTGAYRFSDLEKGNYVVLFQYDTNQYRITEYQKTGVNAQFNSDAVVKEVTLNGKNIKTGMIEISNLEASVSDMDIGLIQNKKCDFKIDKTISKATVTTKQGTKQYTYNNEKLAKMEIRAKEIEGATVVVEYKIVITNEGEMPATVGKVVDELPEGFTFSSELNKQWSTGTKGQLVNTSVSSKKIEAGESIELTLVATKKMTASTTGTFTNIVKIADITNYLGVEDKNSENDTSKADVIISVSTGAIVYLSIGIVLVVILGVGTFVAYKYGILKIGKISMLLVIVAMIVVTIHTNVQAAAFKWTDYDNYVKDSTRKWGSSSFWKAGGGTGFCCLEGALRSWSL